MVCCSDVLNITCIPFLSHQNLLDFPIESREKAFLGLFIPEVYAKMGKCKSRINARNPGPKFRDQSLQASKWYLKTKYQPENWITFSVDLGTI